MVFLYSNRIEDGGVYIPINVAVENAAPLCRPFLVVLVSPNSSSPRVLLNNNVIEDSGMYQ
jgi:hypothetical protein